MSILCLLAARNCASDVDEYVRSARGFCDGIIALDDGSTDGTGDLLRAEPFVKLTIANRRRTSYAGWDDGSNRNKLLSAARRFNADWVVFVDVDERLDPVAARLLRQFVETDAIPGCAYGFEHVRMWGTLCEPTSSWVYRLFAYTSATSSLRVGRLHFNPIPGSIPRERWLRTRLRLQHFGASDPGGIAARLQKYAEADPDSEYPVDQAGMNAVPTDLVAWSPTEHHAPILLPPATCGSG
jgi:glycosyltransferase involved in cell wall biosynthesis